MLPAPPTPDRLAADALSMRYGRRWLFRDLAFAVEAGAPLAVTGANGAGKSTLLRVLAGVLTPLRGTVTLTAGGHDIVPRERPMRVGFVAPYLQLYGDFSARENLDFLARARRLPEAPRRIGAVLERVGLDGRGDDRLATYSSGMQQRLRVAAALLADPPLLLLDEPSATLDEAGRALVASLVAEPRIVVVATNDPDEAALCPRRLHLGAPGEAVLSEGALSL